MLEFKNSWLYLHKSIKQSYREVESRSLDEILLGFITSGKKEYVIEHFKYH